MLVIAVPHAQLRAVCNSLNGTTGKGLARALVVSATAGVDYRKLRQLLPRCPHVVRLTVNLNSLSSTTPLSLPMDVAAARRAAAAAAAAPPTMRDSLDAPPDSDVSLTIGESSGISLEEGGVVVPPPPAPAPAAAPFNPIALPDDTVTEAVRHLFANKHVREIFSNVETFYMALGANEAEARATALLNVIGVDPAPTHAPETLRLDATGDLDMAALNAKLDGAALQPDAEEKGQLKSGGDAYAKVGDGPGDAEGGGRRGEAVDESFSSLDRSGMLMMPGASAAGLGDAAGIPPLAAGLPGTDAMAKDGSREGSQMGSRGGLGTAGSFDGGAGDDTGLAGGMLAGMGNSEAKAQWDAKVRRARDRHVEQMRTLADQQAGTIFDQFHAQIAKHMLVVDLPEFLAAADASSTPSWDHWGTSWLGSRPGTAASDSRPGALGAVVATELWSLLTTPLLPPPATLAARRSPLATRHSPLASAWLYCRRHSRRTRGLNGIASLTPIFGQVRVLRPSECRGPRRQGCGQTRRRSRRSSTVRRASTTRAVS